MNAPALAVIPLYTNYLLFSPVHDVMEDLATARKEFVRRFGAEPAEVVQDHHGIWAGPAPVKVAKGWAE
jgi:hypothetical protein